MELAYKGTCYSGWQIQPNATTVQQTIETALSTILREEISVVGCGRTDAGVHAWQHFAHFNCKEKLDQRKLAYKLNNLLPNDISIHSIRKTHEDAHARFDATSRSYCYQISQQKSPFLFDYCYFTNESLDLSTLNDGAAILIGKHDFQSFSKVKTEVNNFICEVFTASWESRDNLLIFNISANRFLRGMIRTIVGTLLDVGKNKTSLETFKNIIQAKDRTKAGKSVPAKGLFLNTINYPEAIFIDE